LTVFLLKNWTMKLQSESYNGPMTLTEYGRFRNVRDTLAKESIKLPVPSGNGCPDDQTAAAEAGGALRTPWPGPKYYL
jgi:hypothetical protein